MRPRIRSIKPEVHHDEVLWDLEVETGLPIFRAFTGLWNMADREGRFEWRPRALKASILPYWEGDFSRVLDALASRGFVVRYAVGTAEFGHVRTFLKHQSINNKEEPSKLPPPPAQVPESAIDSTRSARVNDATGTPLSTTQGERKGREGKGAEGSDACATREPTAPAAEAISGRDVCVVWHRALNGPGGTPGALHAEHAWRRDYESIAATINTLPEPERAIALEALVSWFWRAPDGPIASGRIKRSTANPGHLCKRIGQDLQAASAWWLAHPEAAQ